MPPPRKTTTGKKTETNTDQKSPVEEKSNESKRSGTTANLGQPESPAKKCHFWDLVSDGNNPEKMDTAEEAATTIDVLKLGESTNKLKLRIVKLGPLAKSGTGTLYLKFVGRDETGSIEGICFGDEAGILADMLKIRQCVEIVAYVVRLSSIDLTKKELTIKSANAVSWIDDDCSLPDLDYDLKTLQHVFCASEHACLDISGIIVQVDEMRVGLSAANNKQFKVRTIYLTDNSTKTCLPVTIWGAEAEYFVFKLYQPIVILQGRVQLYRNEKNLNCAYDTTIWVNPGFPEVETLQKWFMAECKAHGISTM